MQAARGETVNQILICRPHVYESDLTITACRVATFSIICEQVLKHTSHRKQVIGSEINLIQRRAVYITIFLLRELKHCLEYI